MKRTKYIIHTPPVQGNIKLDNALKVMRESLKYRRKKRISLEINFAFDKNGKLIEL